MAVYLQLGKQRNVGWVLDDSHVVFGQKFRVEKGSMRWCVVVIKQKVLLSPKFTAMSSHIFMQSPLNVTAVCGVDCLACQDKFFVNITLDIKENYEHALDLALYLSCHFFQCALNQASHSHTHLCSFCPEHLSNHCQGLPHFLRNLQKKFDAHSLSDPSRNHIRL
jgi:hypothetical protein